MAESYYFTFGSADHFPFGRDSFVKVEAADPLDAQEAFRKRFPDHTPGVLNCAFVYTQDEFESIAKKYYSGVRPAEEIVSEAVLKQDHSDLEPDL